MKLAVIGAGAIGVTTAYELAQSGHEVTVFERRQTAAEEASFSSGGLISPGWLALHMGALESVRSLFPGPAGGSGLRLNRLPSGQELQWLWRSLRSGRASQAASQLVGNHQLTSYSQQRLWTLTAELQLEYDHCQELLVLLRSARDSAQAAASLPLMRELGIGFKEIPGDQIHLLEPALSTETALHGAIQLTGDEAANCRQFTLLLKSKAQQLGCRFEFSTQVERLDSSGGVYLRTKPSTQKDPGAGAAQRFDGAVVCTGASSLGLLRPLGLVLPLQAVYGHAISAAVREPLDTPQAAVLDARHGVSIVRMGQRIRVAGGSRLGETQGVKSKAELRRLYQVLSDWFPGAARLGGGKDSVQEWQGAQAMTPDGSPVLGESGVPGVWLNLGHGAHGWAMACGSARVLADLVQGQTPGIDVAAFGIQRFAR